MRQAIEKAASLESGYFVCSAKPRLIDGKPSANVRYLQNRPDQWILLPSI
jgi:phosphoenolpyruvate carboxykinase (diphosphate)